LSGSVVPNALVTEDPQSGKCRMEVRMADERRYREDEVAEIFEAASAPVPSRRDASPSEGLTLAELQAIGREVGIAPDRIADAAHALHQSPARIPRRTDFGMPISVGRTVELPRALTDREWGLLVADLRQTFNARGNESTHGATRQWTNGNLHAYVEPTPTGYRLRLGTLKGDGVALNRLGAGGIGMGLLVAMAPLLAGAGTDLAGALWMGGMGAGAFAYNALRLPRWARERDEQMDYITERVRALVGPATETAPDQAGADR
jgi:hypothetical protein